MAQTQLDPYDPPIGVDAIRLFRIHQNQDGRVLVELRRFPLEGIACPPFVATSYVWGPKTYTDGLLVNGQPARVLPSALSFLKAMLTEKRRQKFPPSQTWWWMDSICINQHDDNERSAQVQLMSVIYTRAKQTCIWLGDESNDSDIAMEFLHTLACEYPLKFTAGRMYEIENNVQGWTAVGSLLVREWFERCWTLQEFLLGRHATFYCGSKMISRGRMFAAVGMVWDWQQWKHDIIPRKNYEKAWNRFRMLERYNHESSLPLVGTLAYTATFRVSDPRDRLYSLLGLANHTDCEVVGRPDYDLDPRTVFVSFVKSFVEKHQSLDVICLAAVMRGLRIKEDDTNAGFENLPSWAPDWSIRLLHSGPVPSMASQSARTHIGNFRPVHSIDFSAVYAAARDTTPRVVFSGDLLRMTCSGILLDRIDGLGGGKQVRADAVELVQSTSATNTQLLGGGRASQQGQMADSFFWTTVPRSLVLDRRDRYLRHPAPMQDFSKEFQVLSTAAITKSEGVHAPFMDWFRRNKDLRIHGISIEEAAQRASNEEDGKRNGVFDLSDISKALEKLPGLSNWKSFVSRMRDTTWTMGLRLMVTDSGLVGMAPRDAKKGDVVAVLLGCSIPLALRPIPDQDSYAVVGECFVPGYMNGEILSDNIRDGHQFRLV